MSTPAPLDIYPIDPRYKTDPSFRTDPLKGQWGGFPRRNGRILAAEVTPYAPDWYLIRLIVKPEPGAPPLDGPVRFFVHPSFPESTILVDPDEEGKAVTELVSYGSFTVAAQTDIRGRNSNKLELDLAELPDVPEKFRKR